ncbi:hypothetical protein BUALT_Bualt13G0020700 [Buddleja alternifolia]|uniref:RRM domain-containing protein n=1 Tax=Buddleja alternifolia TaxID=168488 RepID=A0AAV6WI36_9LAMI|nr:hypothetical protein BUALT_Bualt13G0020700 [Buddleja alternifolia]
MNSSSSDDGKLFIGGIGWDTTEERLKDHFTHYGDVTHAMIMRDRVTSQPRGFGFVVFSDPSVIPSVLQQTHTIDGRTVEAKRAMSREQQQTLKSATTSPAPNFQTSETLKTKKIFVGGLPSTLTEDEFKEYFQDYGYVTDVVIMYDPSTGRPRGFGFITFTTEDAVDRVLEKTFHELNGKRVEVKQALPKNAVIGGRNYRGYGSYNSSGRMFSTQIGSNRFMQPPQLTSGGYLPYSGYGGSSYGYIGNSNIGFSAYGGYGVGGYGSGNVGYAGPGGVFGSTSSPNGNFSRNQWRGQSAGYGASGYSQGARYGASVPLSNASGGGVSGYTSGGSSPSGASRYVNKGYNCSNFGGLDASHAYAGGGAGGENHNGSGSYTERTHERSNSNGSSDHPDASWKTDA